MGQLWARSIGLAFRLAGVAHELAESVSDRQEQATDEAKKIRWLTVEETTRLPEAQAVRVTDAAYRSTGSLPVRVHDGTHLL